MRILLTGASGLLGHTIRDFLFEYEKFTSHIGLLCPNRQELDIVDYKKIIAYLKDKKPDVILHAAALTGLPKCEYDKDLAYITNVKGSMFISGIAKIANVPVIYISTDYVFDGTKGMYQEHDTPNPLSYYAKTKWAGEVAVVSNQGKIIRTSFAKEPWPHKKAFVDKYSSFDRVSVIANLIIRCVIKHTSWTSAVLNIGTEKKSFYDLAKTMMPDVETMKIEDIKGVVIPRDTSLDNTKMLQLLGVSNNAELSRYILEESIKSSRS